ncbi:hypothetical protein [Streptomyces sp. NPDC007369]|uniref:hypothetical protein n=1 Tax=Streptomyces sp. NPDC007369 TaxID=3154589 RepID=UPI00340A847E
MALAAVGGGADFEFGAELGDEHEARGVVLGGDLAAAGAAGASGGHLTGGAVELFEDGGRFGLLWHVAEPVEGLYAKAVLREFAETKIRGKPDMARRRFAISQNYSFWECDA